MCTCSYRYFLACVAPKYYIWYLGDRQNGGKGKILAASVGQNHHFSEGKCPTVIIYSMSYHSVGSYPLYFLRHWILALLPATESLLRRLLLAGDVWNFLKVRSLFFFHLRLFLIKFRIFHSFSLTFLAFLSWYQQPRSLRSACKLSHPQVAETSVEIYSDVLC